MISPVHEEAQRRFQAQATQYLPSVLADELAKHLTVVGYAAGSTLVLQGSSADVVFWIITGIVKVYCLVPDGNRILLRLAGAGDIVGYPTLAAPNDGVLQPFDVQALTKCTVAMFSRDNLVRTIQKLEQPALLRIFEHFNEPWAQAAYRLVNFLGHSFRQRLELTFKNLVSRFGVEDERGLLLNLKLSHMDFAEMIGSSRPMATVLIGEMVADRTIARQGNHQYLVPRSSPIFPRAGFSDSPRPSRSNSAPLRPALRRLPVAASSLESDSNIHPQRDVVNKR